jgi:hypothetical protein
VEPPPKDPSVKYDDIEPSLATGDILIFHGTSGVSLTIEQKTHSPFSHTAMVLRPDPTKPPLIWQAGPDAITKDAFTNTMHGGAQLSTLRENLIFMSNPAFGDTGYIRQLRFNRTPEFETVAMWAIAGLDGIPFPELKTMLQEFRVGQKHVATTDQTFFCSELAAHTLMLMGLLPFGPKPPNAYAPGDFSAERPDLPWLRGASLGPQLILVPPQAPPAPPPAPSTASSSEGSQPAS